MRHKYADLIHAWAEGAELQRKDGLGRWVDHKWLTFSPNCEYRIKPEKKPDVVRYFIADIPCVGSGNAHKTTHDNLKLTFDGETGELKSSEVIK